MNQIFRSILRAWTARSLRNELNCARLDSPANLSGLLNSEPVDYIAAAIVAVNTRGE